MSATSKVAIYVAGATAESVKTQLAELRCYCKEQEWGVVEEFVDSGLGKRKKRPALRKLLCALRNQRVKTVLVCHFGGLAKTVKQFVASLAEFRRLGAECISLRENFNSSLSRDQAIVAVIAATAAFERSVRGRA